MSVLVDTSVWVNHFRNSDAALVDLLLSDRVLTHPLILLEIACGTPPAPRGNTLAALGRLQPANQASFLMRWPHLSNASNCSGSVACGGYFAAGLDADYARRYAMDG